MFLNIFTIKTFNAIKYDDILRIFSTVFQKISNMEWIMGGIKDKVNSAVNF